VRIFIGYQTAVVTDMAYSLSGFNGQRPDPVSGHSHLGNGYRAYTPALGRFTAPDSMSPFGAGGINPYAYCAGDPVNRADPSGHFSLGQGIGIALSLIAGLALSIVTEGTAIPVEQALVGAFVGGGFIGMGTEVAAEKIDGQQLNWGQVAISTGIGAAAALVAFGGVKTKSALTRVLSRFETRVLPQAADSSAVTVIQKNSLKMVEERFTRLFRVDMQPPEKVLKDGFRESTDFRGVPKMIPENEKALIVAEDINGALRYQAGPLNGKGHLYEIKHPGIRGASLTSNINHNTADFDGFLAANGRNDPNRLNMAARVSEEFREAHIYLDDLKTENISLIKNSSWWKWF
jgi:RHS repeat-associated protein